MPKTIRKDKLFVFALLALALVAVPVWAQTGLGVVRGTVQDATGAVIPGANVTLTNQETGVIRETETNEVGIYDFRAVPLGEYILEVEMTGFKKWESTFNLPAGQTMTIDPSMEVGTVDTVVEVSGAATPIATEGMEVADVKDFTRIRQLPLDGRFVTNLFTLTPGVEGGVSPRTIGMKVGSTEMMLDGMSVVDRFGGGMSRVQPGLDTIQEFRVETVGSNARNSRPATVTLVTRSGTNEFHGSLFHTHRNNFGGLRARQRQDGNDPAQLIRNEFGASAGGPVIRNKLFWFGAYEGSRLRQNRFTGTSVPTDAMWNGDLSNLIDSNNIQTMVYDPLTTAADGTRELFPNLQIPQSRFSSFAQGMREITPSPTIAGVNPLVGRNFEAFYPNQTDLDQFTGKIDFNLSNKDVLMGRTTISDRNNALFGGRFGVPPPGCTNCGGSGRQDARIYNSVIRWTRTFSPTMLNELQVANHRSPKSSGTLGDNTDWAGMLGLPNPFDVTGWPTLCGPSGFFIGGWGCWDGDNRKDENLTSWQIDDNVNWIKGKHSMSFGVKLRQEYNNIRELQQAQGSHSFGGDWTAQFDPVDQQAVSFTGHGMGSVLLGLPTFLSNQANRGFFYFEQFEMGLYFHDSWKVSPRTTLELGVRYDRWTPYGEKRNRLVNIDPATVDSTFQVVTRGDVRMEEVPGILPAQLESWRVRGLDWTTANSIGFPSNLLPADNNNFGPRIGVAHRLGKNFVIRAGYGEYFWTMPLSQILQTARTTPPLNLRFTNSVSNLQGKDDFYALANVPASNDFIANNSVPTEGIVEISSRARSGMMWDVRDWKDNRMQSWHFTVEQEILPETALRLSYIGNHGRDLEQRFSTNQRESQFNYQARTGLQVPTNPDLRRVNPDWNLRAANHTGFSNSHSLQAEVEKRYANGLAFQWFYTFSRTLTTTDEGGFQSGNGSINPTGSGNFRVPQNNELIGAPNLSYDDRLDLGYYNTANVPAHRIRWNAVWDLPFGRGKKWGDGVSSAMNQVVGGWQLATIGTWRSGFWSSVRGYLFRDPTLDADQRLELTLGGQRRRLFFAGDFDPTLASDVDQNALQQLVPVDRSQRALHPVGENFDNRVAQQLADGSVRQTSITDMMNWTSRNFFRGPGSWNADISVFKNFVITEDVNVRFTTDFFNAFNAPMDVDPSSSSGLQDLSRQANAPRIIQFSLRVNW